MFQALVRTSPFSFASLYVPGLSTSAMMYGLSHGAEASTGQQGPPQALTTVGKLVAAPVVLSKPQHQVPFVEVSAPNSLRLISSQGLLIAQSVGAPRLEPRPLDPASPRGLAGSAALDRP